MTQDCDFMNYNGNSFEWNPSIEFFNSGQIRWQGNQYLDSTDVFWSFKKYTHSYFPLKIIECKIVASGLEAKGISISLNEQNSIRKSFAEAWERIFYLILKNKKLLNFKIVSSNGFAAGSSANMAIEKSRYELMEREVLLRTWGDQKKWKKVHLKSFFSIFMGFLLNLRGYNINCFEVETSLGIFTACLIQDKKFRSFFDCSFHSVFMNRKIAIQETFFSTIKAIIFFGSVLVFDFKLFFDGRPKDHLYFYLDAKNFDAFDFLKSGLLEESSKFDFIFSDDTKTILLCEPCHFPAVAFSYNEKWIQLRWGEQSIIGGNKWPHPLS